jgi:transcriptional regulator with XRE-family HTH domain
MAGQPLTDAEKQQIRKLHADGLSRNAIAKALGRSAGAISNFCAAQGLTFPQVERIAQVASAAVTIAERSIAAHERQLRIVEHQQAKLLGHYDEHKPWATKMRGTEGSEYTDQLDFIPSEDERNITSAIANSVSSLAKLAPVDKGHTAVAESVLDRLEQGFAEYAAQAPEEQQGGN